MVDKIEVLDKYAKKFADLTPQGPYMLAGIYYASDGAAYVTNAKYALRIRNAHSHKEPVVVHAEKKFELKGNYPMIEEFFEKHSQFDYELTLREGGGFKEITRATKLIKVADDIAKNFMIKRVCNLVMENRELKVTTPMGETINYSAPIAAANEPYEYINTFNSNFLFNAFDVFRYTKTQVLSISLKNGPNPILLKDATNEIDVIIMPFGRPH